MFRFSQVLLLILAVPLAACSSSPQVFYTNSSDGSSGIEGRVVIGPTCPVQRAEDPNCADKPYQATVMAYKDGQIVMKTASDAEGRFKMSLEPGTYTLVPQRVQGQIARPVPSEMQIIVLAGKYAQIVMSYDSGIR